MPGRAVRAVLLTALVLSAPGLAFLSHAPNRLLSGRPVSLLQAASLPGAPMAASVLAATILVLLASLAWHRVGPWVTLVAAGLGAGALGWFAARCATALAAGAAPAARTSLGSAFWVMLLALLLIAIDSAGRVPQRAYTSLLAGVIIAAPLLSVLASGAADQLSLLREYANQRDIFPAAVAQHGRIVVLALLPALLTGIPIGIAAQRRPGLRRGVFPVLNIIQTIPSIALFGLLMAPLSGLAAAFPIVAALGIAGIGLAPAVIALLLYSLLPITRGAVEGLDGVPAPVLDAARGMGMTAWQRFRDVELPLALPVFLAALRITAVQAVGLAAVAALIGAGGLGAIMFRGLFANALDLVLLGAVPVILLAVLVDFLLRLLAAISGPRLA